MNPDQKLCEAIRAEISTRIASLYGRLLTPETKEVEFYRGMLYALEQVKKLIEQYESGRRTV